VVDAKQMRRTCVVRRKGTYRPKSLKNRFVYCNGVVDGTELQVGDAVVWLHGVSRSSDQKWMPARPLATA
jgi:hypothetical protein